MSKVSSRELGGALVEILGLEHVKKLELICEAGQPATVKAEHFITSEQGALLNDLITKKYRIAVEEIEEPCHADAAEQTSELLPETKISTKN